MKVEAETEGEEVIGDNKLLFSHEILKLIELAQIPALRETDESQRISSASFVTQPPSNLRKSNFFNFSVQLYDANHYPIKIESCSFVSFCDEDEFKNGAQYQVNLVLPNEFKVQQKLFVRMVDSETKNLIRYDNSGKAPIDLQRVLVTHRAMCSRCSEGKVCGNKNEMPTDPVVIDNFELKFFLKCNQNCLKGPGRNPKNPRRFQVIVSTTEKCDLLCISQKMFVHNNSKHTKTLSFAQANGEQLLMEDPKKDPKILAISPSEGWTIGGQTIVIIGDNFRPDIQVIFGTVPVLSQFITSHAIRVQSPPWTVPGSVEVTLAIGVRQYFSSDPGKFKYVSPEGPSLEYGFNRLSKLVPRYPGDPQRLDKEVVLERAADVVETFYSTPLGGSSSIVDMEDEIKEGNIFLPWHTETNDLKIL